MPRLRLSKVVETIPYDETKTLVTDFNAELYVINTGKKQAYNPRHRS